MNDMDFAASQLDQPHERAPYPSSEQHALGGCLTTSQRHDPQHKTKPKFLAVFSMICAFVRKSGVGERERHLSEFLRIHTLKLKLGKISDLDSKVQDMTGHTDKWAEVNAA